MGEYTSLYVDGFELFSNKSYVFPELMLIFRESDKRVYKRPVVDRLRREFPGKYYDIDESSELANEVEIAFEYSNTVPVVKQRLDILGFTLRRAVHDFAPAKRGLCAELEREIAYYGDAEETVWTELRELKQAYLSVLRDSTFDDWSEAYAEILNHKLKRAPDATPKDEVPTLVHYILKKGIESSFPGDFRSFIRVFLENAPAKSLVIQDLTRVYQAGYYELTDRVCTRALDLVTGDYPVYEKIIVLTEGSTDARILKNSMELLYPNLSEYYSFMDFGVSNVRGGADALVSTVKAVIGSGIRNRVIAIFDNDTAATVALRGLEGITIPDNIRILRYPVLELASAYPTWGPAGIHEVDVNGLAGSIELYLGTDALTEDDGTLTPVQWKGFDRSLKQYQGELQRKSEVQQAFDDKMMKCRNDPSLIEETDWEDMRSVLNCIFKAFT